MKIVIALDSFKGSCSAQAACAAVAEDCAGLTRRWSWSKCPCPTAERDCCRLWRIVRCLRGGVATAALYLALWPLLQADFLILPGERAIIEMAQSCGLELTPPAQRMCVRPAATGWANR